MWDEREESGVAIATYTAPPMNYFTDAAVDQLDDMIHAWRASPVSAVVLTGGVAGRFITHFDVDEILENQQQPDPIFDAPRRSRRLQAMLRRLNALPQPVVAALNGDTMGFGYELALSADLRIAQWGDFRIGLPEVRLGLIPSSSGVSRLVKLVGVARALDLLLRGRVLTPEEALAYGLVTEIADDALKAAIALSKRLADLPSITISIAKRAVYQTADLPLDIALGLEAENSFRLKQAPEIMEPMRQYLALPPEQRRDFLDAERLATE